jgi:Holliday junction DNA helicase RuvA
MISFVKGRLVEKTPTMAIVDCNGLGYEMRISAHTYESLNEESVMLLTHYAITVDVRSGASTHQLFGFLSKAERDMFRLLVTVSGVSSTIAMTIQSTLSMDQLRSAILHGEATMFKTVKGIGPKLAQRIVTELAEKGIVGEVQGDIAMPSGNMARQEALAALCSLGFDRIRVDKTLNAVVKESPDELNVEEMIKRSLKAL